MSVRTLGFVGGGRITFAILTGLNKKRMNFDSVLVSDPDGAALAKLEKAGLAAVPAPLESVLRAEAVFLAVHPPVLKTLLPEIARSAATGALIVSLAPKLGLRDLAAALEGRSQLARVNPSALCFMNRGVNAVSFGPGLTAENRDFLLDLFSRLSRAVVVDDELIEAYAVVNAMGPTYFWFQYRALRDLGLRFGLEKSAAEAAIADAVCGAAEALFFSGLDEPGVLDLIPVHPLKQDEEQWKKTIEERLAAVFEKIRVAP
jgi:pyrroline-5-carboxylate reductase